MIERIRENLTEVFFDGSTDVAKRYLNLLIEEITDNDDKVSMKTDLAKIFSNDISRTETGTAEELTAVPTFDLDWPPYADDCGNLVEDFASFLTQELQRHIEADPLKPYPPPPSAITLAFEYQSMLDRGVLDTQAKLAEQVGVTPARIGQLLKILTELIRWVVGFGVREDL